MCVVSMIGDHYSDKWSKPIYDYILTTDGPTKEEFDTLKKEVLEMKDLLKKALDYDKKNNEPDCQIEDKMDYLRKVAASVGISLDDVLGLSSIKQVDPIVDSIVIEQGKLVAVTVLISKEKFHQHRENIKTKRVDPYEIIQAAFEGLMGEIKMKINE